MSVLIKGMEMPNHCIDCPMKNFEDDCVVQEHSNHWHSWEDMRKGCPLVEVPTPHGRLIDAEQTDVLDKIRAEIERDAFKDVNGSKYIFVNRINQIIDKYKESEGKE